MTDATSGATQFRSACRDYKHPASRTAKRIADGNIRLFYSSLFLDPEEAQYLQHLAEKRKESTLALLVHQEETKRKIRNQSLVTKDWTRTAPSVNGQSTDRWSKYRLSIERQGKGSPEVEISNRTSTITSALSEEQMTRSERPLREQTSLLANTESSAQKGLTIRHSPFFAAKSQAITKNDPTRSADPSYCAKLSDIGVRYIGERLRGSLNPYLTIDAEQILSSMWRYDNRFSERQTPFGRSNLSMTTVPK